MQEMKRVYPGATARIKSPWGNLYVTLNFDGEKPYEAFATLEKVILNPLLQQQRRGLLGVHMSNGKRSGRSNAVIGIFL